MLYYPQQSDIQLVKQTSKVVNVRIELLNRNLTIVGELDGNLISDSFSVTSDSKQRRTYSCNLYVKDSSFQIGPDTKIWIDKYIRVYYQIMNNRTHKFGEWLLGTFTFVSPNYSYSDTTKQLSLQCADLMADYDGTKNGQLIGTHSLGEYTTEERLKLNMSYTFKINAVAEYETDKNGEYIKDENGMPIVKSYTKMRDAILATLRLAGIPDSRYMVEDYTDEGQKYVPYDLEFNAGQNFSDIWDQLCNLYSNWEYFFDIYGNFVWQKIPTCYDDEIVMDNTLIDPLLISENHNNTFGGIYNVTEVWGKSFEITLNDRYADTSTLTDNTYVVTLPMVDDPTIKEENKDKIESYFNDADKIAFNVSDAPTDTSNLYIKITGTFKDDATQEITKTLVFDPVQVFDSSMLPIPDKTIEAGHVYVFTYHRTIKDDKVYNYFVFDGGTQAYGYYEETNKDCPFSVTNLGYRIPQRISMDTDYTDDLCYNRAERQTYISCAMQDSINLTMIIVPWLDVNQKIKYVSQFDPEREKRLQIETPQWIIKSISWSTLDGTMQLSAYRFREDFSWVWARRHPDTDQIINDAIITDAKQTALLKWGKETYLTMDSNDIRKTELGTLLDNIESALSDLLNEVDQNKAGSTEYTTKYQNTLKELETFKTNNFTV